MRGGTIREEVHWKNDAISGSERLKNAILRSLGYPVPRKRKPRKPVAPVFMAPCRRRGRPKGHTNPIRTHTKDLHKIHVCVARCCEVRVEGLFSRHRTTKLVFARQIAAYVSRHALGSSFPQIGNYYRLHHTSVMHSCAEVQRRIDEGCISTIRALQRVHTRLAA